MAVLQLEPRSSDSKSHALYIQPLPDTSRPEEEEILNPVHWELLVWWGTHRSCHRGISSHVEKLVSTREVQEGANTWCLLFAGYCTGHSFFLSLPSPPVSLSYHFPGKDRNKDADVENGLEDTGRGKGKLG